jgi:hypothetical protein
MAKATIQKQLTPSEVQRLVDGLRVAVNFIRANIPADIIATKQTHGWERANAALKLKPNTSKNVTEIASTLLWAMTFVVDNYRGSCGPEMADASILLKELGLLVSRKIPDHPTRQ